MKTSSTLPYWVTYELSLLLILSLIACSRKDAVTPITDQIKKVWTVHTVRENGALVYVKDRAGNSRSYSAFRLDLSNPSVATFSDWDGVIATGQYELVGDKRLVLKNLVPPLTGTNGTIEFTINSITDTQVDLTRVATNPKTGNSTNQYVLTNP